MFLLGVLGLALVFADFQFHLLSSLRSSIGAMATPFYYLADVPTRLVNWGEQSIFVSRDSLVQENKRLKQEAGVLRGRMLQMSALVAENGRLRELLNSQAALQSDNVVIAEIIGVSPKPERHELVIDKGGREGISVGQPVIDSHGLMGQVTEVNPLGSRVMLITDASHAVPVQINRNGFRLVAEGIGQVDELELRHVSSTTDIQVGDLLVTSGLGHRFPVGYPVAEVVSVVHDPGRPFLKVLARPSAALNQSRHVLLVYSSRQQAKEAGAPP